MHRVSFKGRLGVLRHTGLALRHVYRAVSSAGHGRTAIYKTRDSAQVAIDRREMSLGIPSTCVP